MVLPSDRDSTGRDLGDEELAALSEAIRSGHLIATAGHFVPKLEKSFAARFGVPHAVACASGSAAVHAALGALRLQPGDEVVTSPITDMGAVMPICYEGARPVFADVDPDTANVDAATLRAAIGPRTRAVIVTHLFGQPCAMGPIVELCRERGVVLIEDVAQAFLATDGGRLCGSFGDFACFSFQQGKHMTTGEGGIVLCRDPARADAVHRFVNKGWGFADPVPDHDRPGFNYRLTELQAAVGCAQLAKLDGVVERRRARAAELCELLAELPGLELPLPRPGTRHSYWRFALHVDPRRVRGGASALGARLLQRGIGNAPHYVKKPAFACKVFEQRREFAPLRAVYADHLDGPLGDAQSHPGVYAALERVLVLPWNEHYTADHVRSIAAALREAMHELREEGPPRG
ncbi:MAG: DegT/DnrJ/EryC1/StrS family aminotransferase [Planctomycetes bacterium]|nr:DegT/DnrJ/EryC1/StrS family aminotransferase [Planctomycetota bacterium]